MSHDHDHAPEAGDGIYDPAGSAEATARFRRLAGRAVDDLLARNPVLATDLGEHRHDGVLPDLSADAAAATVLAMEDLLAELDALDDLALGTDDAVDLEILRSRLSAAAFTAGDLRPHTWNPLVANPGTAVHLLLARDFAPLADRLESVAARLAAVPDHLATARATLGAMPRVHVETAVQQFGGTAALLRTVLEESLVAQPALRGRVDPARASAVAAIEEHVGWLSDRLEDADRDPRLGANLYAGALWHALDAETTPAEVRAQAEADLAELDAEIREVASRLSGEPADAPGLVARVLRQVADAAPVDDGSVLGDVAAALERQTAFVRDRDLVSVPDLDVRVIVMPEIHRGVAVAYCDAPGPLETAAVPTYVAVSPTPAGWDEERVRSFYREYNGHLLENLTAHEAMPGHVLQLAHANAARRSRVRAFGRSGPFVEGWAVYAEELMVERGYPGRGGPDGALALRLQQLKMRLRTTINAILDVGVHADGMTEDEALDLMTASGHQEEGEAVGKWRRALLTAGQLPTYYVGYRGVREIVDDLRVLHPDWTDRRVHDTVLAHGSPAPRHLRALLGI
ncbi:MAG: DUF885 domain-containing protein [Candidatus Nanopelagicales bacterium]